MKPVSYEQIINKSRFIAYLFPIDTVEKANELLKEIRKKHYDANHNCYSYIIGTDHLAVKSSDDGEPSQTAGVVIYEVLRKNQLTNVLAIVTRYFGGIKLGAGGLIRAYGSSVSEALKIADLGEIVRMLAIEIIVDYPYLDLVQIQLENYQFLKREFTDKVCLIIYIPETEYEELKVILSEITKGSVKIKLINSEMAPIPEIRAEN
ncbi:MAG: YigZ family protein [Bacilli bacterium]|nr:YigZ family protein [Bacilli bacterium]